MKAPSELAAEAPYSLTALDLASGFLTGVDRTLRPAVSGSQVDLATALRLAITEAIFGKQAYVSFSGGRDSSAVLAIATDVARRGGQPDPVPLTLRVVGSASADEAEWQEMVVRHLRLRDWIRIPVTDQLDVIGPVSTRVLGRQGLLYPANAYFHDLLAEQAMGGVLLAGGGGDELLEGSYAHHHARAWLGIERLTARTAMGIAASIAAKPLYVRHESREIPRFRWLRPYAQAVFAKRLVGGQPAPVRGWAAGIAPLVRSRAMVGLQRGQGLIGSAKGTRIVNPFLDPVVVGAAMTQGGKAGLGGRAQAMRSLAGALLPDAVAVRQTKASFEDAMWTSLSRECLRSDVLLDVIQADRRLARYVDIDGLRAEWNETTPHGLTSLLVQSAYLALSGGS
jgi:hypothetical protein